MARKRDSIDLLLESWAIRRRELLGIRHPLTAREYIGALKCTLGQRRDLHHGSKTNISEQHWPEFPYTDDLALVNRAIKTASPTLQEIYDWHWTLTMPRDKRLRADLMGISPRMYWERVKLAKERISGALAISSGVRTSGADSYGT